VSEGFDSALEMVTDPDGDQWIIEARRPRHSTGEWEVVIAKLGALIANHREWISGAKDPSARVTDLARLVESGEWPT
jgi:hypothetical protein